MSKEPEARKDPPVKPPEGWECKLCGAHSTVGAPSADPPRETCPACGNVLRETE